MANETETITTKEVAEALETDGRTLRKFLRSEVKAAGGTVGEDTPGKGKRYSFQADEIASLRERFEAWVEARNAPADDSEEELEEELTEV